MRLYAILKSSIAEIAVLLYHNCTKERRTFMFERKEYTVERLDGDYAYLREDRIDDLKCVARALLPEAIREGSRLSYEMMEYEIVEV